MWSKDPLEDDYIHPEYKSCPKERTLMNMLSDVKFLIQGKPLIGYTNITSQD